MTGPFQPRASGRARRTAARAALTFACVAPVLAFAAPVLARQSTAAGASNTAAVPPYSPPVTPRDASAAHAAYLAGARALERNHLPAAQREFARANQLDPSHAEYAVALELARQHQLTALVQQAGRARLSGDPARADALLAQARVIDPANPLVQEHPAAPARVDSASGSLGNRARLMDTEATPAWKLPPPLITGPIHLAPTAGKQDLHLRGDSGEVVRQVAAAFGIQVTLDPSLDQTPMRFDMDGATYDTAMPIALSMAHAFAVATGATSGLVAKDNTQERQLLEPLLEETIFVPGNSVERITDLTTLIRNIFGITKASVQTTNGTIVVRAPESILAAMNATLQQLIDSDSEIVLDVKLYETDITRSRNIGATLPTQAGVYNVDAAATQLVNSNQSLVQQAIAQGLISSTASNLQIAFALLASGLVQSSLLSSTLGYFGGGITTTGVTETGTVGVNLSLNETDTRTLDDVQMHLEDRQAGTFRSGTRYPIITSTYSSGISTPASALSNATINGVSVASLLAQYAGGSSVTIPQITYEDLGLTLKATPVIQRSGSVSLTLDMKVEALGGTSLNGNPILDSRQFLSSISLGDGETAMLVSNLSKTETAAVSGLPGLSELPGFQIPINNNTEKDSSQLIVLITPHVIRRRLNPLSGPQILVRLPAEGEGGLPQLPGT